MLLIVLYIGYISINQGLIFMTSFDLTCCILVMVLISMSYCQKGKHIFLPTFVSVSLKLHHLTLHSQIVAPHFLQSLFNLYYICLVWWLNLLCSFTMLLTMPKEYAQIFHILIISYFSYHLATSYPGFLPLFYSPRCSKHTNWSWSH